MFAGDAVFLYYFSDFQFYSPFPSTSFLEIKGLSWLYIKALRIAFDGLRFFGVKAETWVGLAPRRDGLKWIEEEREKRHRRWSQSSSFCGCWRPIKSHY